MRSSLAVQLFNLGRSSLSVFSSPPSAGGPSREGSARGGRALRASSTLPSGGGRPGGPPNLARSSTITLAVPLVEEDTSAHGGGEGGKPGEATGCSRWVEGLRSQPVTGSAASQSKMASE